MSSRAENYKRIIEELSLIEKGIDNIKSIGDVKAVLSLIYSYIVALPTTEDLRDYEMVDDDW